MRMRIHTRECQLNVSDPVHIERFSVEFQRCASCCSFTHNIVYHDSQISFSERCSVFDFINHRVQFIFWICTNRNSNVDCFCSVIFSKNSSSVFKRCVVCIEIKISNIIVIRRNNTHIHSIVESSSVERKHSRQFRLRDVRRCSQ